MEMPFTAVPINVTAIMPMMTPSAVSVDRVRFERICAAAIFQLSLTSYRKRFMASSSRDRQVELRNKSRVIGLDQSVAQMHSAPRMSGDVSFVGHEDNGVAALI